MERAVRRGATNADKRSASLPRLSTVRKHRRAISDGYQKLGLRKLRPRTVLKPTKKRLKSSRSDVCFAPKIFGNQFFRDKYSAEGDHERVFNTSSVSSSITLYESIPYPVPHRCKRRATSDLPVSSLCTVKRVPDNSLQADCAQKQQGYPCASLWKRLMAQRDTIETSFAQFSSQLDTVFDTLKAPKHAKSGPKRILFGR